MEFLILRIRRMNTCVDEENERNEDERDRDSSEDRKRLVPAKARVLSSRDTVREYQVDDVENRDTGVEEKVADELQAVVARSGSPG